MTSVEEYTGAFNTALNALVRGLPNAHILVLSVPDLARLWEVGRDYPEVRRVWDSYGICQSMLADPTDITAGAQARRDRVRARIQAYNAAMTAACARHTPHRRGDGNAVLTTTDSTSKTSVRAITGTRATAVRQHWHKLRGKQASGHDCGNRHGARGRTSIGSDARLGP